MFPLQFEDDKSFLEFIETTFPDEAWENLPPEYSWPTIWTILGFDRYGQRFALIDEKTLEYKEYETRRAAKQRLASMRRTAKFKHVDFSTTKVVPEKPWELICKDWYCQLLKEIRKRETQHSQSLSFQPQ